MLLAIDVGNTNIVFGIYKNTELIETFRLRTCKDYTTDEIGLNICHYFAFHNLDIKNIEGVIIASVVPQMINILKATTKRYLTVDPLIVGVNVIPNINNLYYTPAQAGIDRLVNAVAAVQKYGAPLIIVDMGTATTFDAVNSAEEFMGGTIFPGVNTLSEALTSNITQLPAFNVLKPKNVIGKSTIENLQSGAYYGYIGAIEGIISNMKREMGERVKVIATGGLSALISDNTELIDIIDNNLTLDGLRLIYESKTIRPIDRTSNYTSYL